jgi:hypothetical protein
MAKPLRELHREFNYIGRQEQMVCAGCSLIEGEGVLRKQADFIPRIIEVITIMFSVYMDAEWNCGGKTR